MMPSPPPPPDESPEESPEEAGPRPGKVRTAGILFFVIAAVQLVNATITLVLAMRGKPLIRNDAKVSDAALYISGAISGTLGVITFLVGRGVLGRRRWARTTGIVIGVLAAVNGLLSLPQGILLLVIGVVAVVLLSGAEAKRWFATRP